MRPSTHRALFAALAVACTGGQTPEVTPEPEVAPVPEPAPAVSPIPEGFSSVTPTLIVADIPAAVEFYKTALGAEHVYTTDGPDGAPMHAEIRIGDSMVMLSPESPDHKLDKSPKTLGASNGSLLVYVEDVDATFKSAVDAGARALMPVADMWWGDRYGEILDPQGQRWSLATHKEEVSSEVMKERAAAATEAMQAGKDYTWEKGAEAKGYKPDEYHTVTPTLVVSGGAAAVDFYKNALGAEVVVAHPTPDGNLMHAELRIGDAMVMLSGEMPEGGPMAEMAKVARSGASLGASPLQLMVYVPDTDAALAKAVGAGAAKVMDATDMFWGDRFALTTDPAGNAWAIATHIEDVSPEEIKTRMMAQMKAHGEEMAPEVGAGEQGAGAEEEAATHP